jgi:hypothetical protein
LPVVSQRQHFARGQGQSQTWRGLGHLKAAVAKGPPVGVGATI